MLSQTPAAIRVREQRASMTPEKRAAYLARRVEYNRERRGDPRARDLEKATRQRGYQKLKADPVKHAQRRKRETAQYWANQRWRLVQEAGLRSAKRGFEFDLTKEWAEATRSDACAVTGLPFVIGGKRNNFSVSLDRVDNTRGYTQDNCRWVLWAVNLLKHTGTDAEMFEIAKAIVRSAP